MRRVVLLSVLSLAALTLKPLSGSAQITAELVVKFSVPEAKSLGRSLSVYADSALLGTFAPEAYLFQLHAGDWWMSRLVSPDARGTFGDVRLAENVAVIGAAPYVYVFRFDGSTWFYEATLLNDRRQGVFGHSVDIDGELIAVGTPSADVQVFRFDGRKWAREAKLAPPARDEGQIPYGFADRVVIDDERILVRKSSTMGDGFEGVYAFRRDATGWYHEDTITIKEPGGERILVGDIALDGNLALIQADYGDAVHVFRFDGFVWKREAILEPPERDTPTCFCIPVPADGGEVCGGYNTPNFGVSVALDDGLALVGANLDDALGTDSGAAYLYDYDGTEWRYELMLQGEPTSFCGGNFGRLVALHQGRALIRQGDSVYFFRVHRAGK